MYTTIEIVQTYKLFGRAYFNIILKNLAIAQNLRINCHTYENWCNGRIQSTCPHKICNKCGIENRHSTMLIRISILHSNLIFAHVVGTAFLRSFLNNRGRANELNGKLYKFHYVGGFVFLLLLLIDSTYI